MRRQDLDRKARAFALRKAGRPAPPPPDPLPRIEALTKNARTTWFTLLGVLVFVGVTLMGVEHIDFYGVNRATQLPLVNVSVPTRLFFLVAPVLTAAAFGYFHLYLIRLWDELGQAPARIGGRPLGDAVTPWLVTDAALHIRDGFRHDGSRRKRPLETLSMVLNVSLAWGFGLVVLGYGWLSVQPARETAMNAVNALALVAAALAALASALTLIEAMRPHGHAWAAHRWLQRFGATVLAVLALLLAGLSYATAHGPVGYLAPIDLGRNDVVERPADWLPYPIARADFRADWCQRENVSDCSALSDPDAQAFEAEWKSRRAAAVASLVRPSLAGRDLRGAHLGGAYLAGADLQLAHMQYANLLAAQAEGTTFVGTDLRNATLMDASLEGALMVDADLREATLVRTRLNDANLSSAMLVSANLFQAELERADLYLADLSFALLNEAALGGARLIGANLRRAILDDALLEGADLGHADLTGARLHRTRLIGATLDASYLAAPPRQFNVLAETRLEASRNAGGALRRVDLRAAVIDDVTDFRNAFLDGSVLMTSGFRRQMGPPCQWTDEVLDDGAFYGRWRAWLARAPIPVNWETVAPEDWRDVPPQPLDPSCQWKTGPMPGAVQPAQD